jgi:hypothetical protein
MSENEQVVTQQTEQATEQVERPAQAEQDLTSRASEVSLEQSQETEKKYDRNSFNEKLSKLPPEMQEEVKAFQQTLYKGADEKFQEAARLRREAEELRQRGWDKTSVQQLLNDPTFQAQVNELQQERQVEQNPQGSGLSDEEWSYLSPKEKAMLANTQKMQQEDRKKMDQFFQKQEWEKQDMTIKARYKNYEPKYVDEAFNGLVSGKIQATREDLWKAIDYENAVKRAYELGKKDRALDLNEKVTASSPASGFNVNQSKDVPQKGEKENGVEYFKRIAMRNAQKLGIKL